MSVFIPYTFTGQRAVLRFDPNAAFLNYASPGMLFPDLGMTRAWDDVSSQIRNSGAPINNTQVGAVAMSSLSGSALLNNGAYREATNIPQSGGSAFVASTSTLLRPNGTTDFTIEGYVNFSRITPAGRWIWAQYQYASVANTSVYWFPGTGTDSLGYIAAGAAEYNVIPQTANLPPAGTWGHIVFMRSGSTWRTYLDGVQKTQTTFNISVNNPSTAVRYLGHPSNTQGAAMFQDWRFYRGFAKYSGGSNGTKYFDPPPSMIIAP